MVQSAVALSPDQVQHVVDSLPEVEKLTTELQAEGAFTPLQSGVEVMAEGNFSPFSQTIREMQSRAPTAYSAVGDLVNTYGFNNAADWARAADEVLNAFMALKLEEENVQLLAMADQVTPEMLAQLPPAVRGDVERMMRVTQQLGTVPMAHKEAILPFLSEIEAWAR